MKKIIKTILFSLFVFILSILPNSFVRADSDLKITNWNVASKLNTDGSLDITEDITFKFESEYNGVFRDIYIDKTSGIDNINVCQMDNGSEIPYKLADSASNGDNGIYQIIKKGSYDEIKIYSPSKNQEKTFRFRYRMLDVAVKHNDIGELYYNYIGKENKTAVENLNIKLTLPGTGGSINAYVHGGSTEGLEISGSEIIFASQSIKEESIVALRTVFPREYIDMSGKIINKDALNRIAAEENVYAEKLKKDAENMKLMKIMANYGVLFFLAATAVISALFALKFKRTEKYDPDKYYNILPEDCTPAVMKMLYSSYVSTNDIMATLLDLSRKGYIKLENTEESFGKNEKYSDFVIRIEKGQDDNLLQHEKYIIKWLIDDIGDGDRVYLSEIQEFSKNSLKKFTKSFDEWKTMVKNEAKAREYFDERGKKYGIILIVFSIAEFIASFIFIVLGCNYGIVCILLSIIIFIFGIGLIYRRTDYGNIQFQRWKRFKKYYKENEDSIPMESYMAYAVAMGMDKNTFAKYKLKYTDEYYNNASFFWIYWYFTMSDSHDKNMFNESLNSAFGSTGVSSSGSSSSGGAGGGGAGGF